MHFFKILNEIAFLNPNKLRKRQKERLQTSFMAVLNGLLSRQAKIIFSSRANFTFPYSKPSLLNIHRNQQHGIEYVYKSILMVKFHEISILLPKSHKKIRKNTITL